MIRNFFSISILVFILFFSFNSFILAEEDFENFSPNEEKVVIYLFDDRLCPVCKGAKTFLEEIRNDYPQIELYIYSISDTKKLSEIVEKYNVENYRIMAPTIFINEDLFQFNSFTSREKEIIINAIEGKDFQEDCCIIKVPFLNIELDISNWSLPIITIILGAIDGFNVCSVGALILVLSIVVVLKSKKLIFIYGGLFIVTAVVIYGLLVFMWGRLFEALIGQLEILRIIVGLASLFGGIYFFKEFLRFYKYGPMCKSSNSKFARTATLKLKKAFENPNKKFYLLAGSIVFFSAVITIIELPCSVGIPIAFSGILVESGVSLTSYIFYILLYLLFYMLDEIIIFAGAVFTKKIWFSNSKAITWITFIGAMVMFYLAIHYIFGI